MEQNNPSTDPYQEPRYVKMRFPLRRLRDRSVSERAIHMRLNVVEVMGGRSSKRGRLIVDTVRFKGNKWKGVVVDGVEIFSGNQLSFNAVSGEEDDLYSKNQLARAYLRNYEDLHGYVPSSELETLDEKSYRVSYRLSGDRLIAEEKSRSDAGQFAWVERYGAGEESVVDLSGYKEVRLYIYPIDYSSSGEEEFVYRFGEDEDNHYELRIAMKHIGGANHETGRRGRWHELIIKMRGRSAKEIETMKREAYKGDHYFLLFKSSSAVTTGGNRRSPDEEEVDRLHYTIRKVGHARPTHLSYYMVGVDSKGEEVRGTFWLGEFHVAQSEVQISHAIRNALRYEQKRPLYYGGWNVIDDTTAEVEYEYRGLGFNGLENQRRGSSKQSQMQTEKARFHVKTEMLDVVEWHWSRSRENGVSEYDEIFLPKADQFIRQRDMWEFGIEATFEDSPYVPNVSHHIETHLIRRLEMSPYSLESVAAAGLPIYFRRVKSTYTSDVCF